jgi:nucleoside transporter
MNANRVKLCVMMFLQIFIWGAWYPLIFGYLPSLGFGEWEQFAILATFNVAALVAMFFSTQFADRHFAAEKFLAFSHLVAGAAILGLFWIRKPADDASAPFWPFFGLMLVHTLLYVPTISITNSIAFAHLKDPQKEFGPVRLWGTIGWIAASVPFVFILVDWVKVADVGAGKGGVEWLGIVLGTPLMGAAYRQATSYIFVTAGVASFVLAVFSLMLPHTPAKPAAEAGERFAWLEAAKLLAIPFVLVLFVVTFLDATVHQMYFYWTERFLTAAPDHYGVGIPGNWAPQVMSIGQVAEIGTMALLGYVLKSLGWRYTMVIGVLGHAIRFTVFAYFPQWAPAILVNLLHGICYAFFFATVYIFVDEFFPKDARSSAQGLFNLLILGAGPLVGNFLGGRLGVLFKVGEFLDDQGKAQPIYDFHRLFLVPAAIGLVAALILLLFFRPPAKASPSLHPGLEDALAHDIAGVNTAPSDAIMDAKRRDGITE